jgi:hypothetical protein
MKEQMKRFSFFSTLKKMLDLFNWKPKNTSEEPLLHRGGKRGAGKTFLGKKGKKTLVSIWLPYILNTSCSAQHNHRKSLDFELKQQQETDSDSFARDSLTSNQNNYVRHRRVLDMATRNDRNISKADEEIEKF